MSRYTKLWLVSGLIALLLLAACQGILTPPRESTNSTDTAIPPGDQTPLILVAPSPTPGGRVDSTPAAVAVTDPLSTLTVWVNETSAAHEEVLNGMVQEFASQQAVNVELRLVSPALLPKLVETAVISAEFELPDIIIHPVVFTAGWAERGILDVAAANSAVTEIGRETFDADALALVQVDGQTAALPSDGYQQLIVFRTDWFARQDLAPPQNWEALLTAAGVLFDPESLVAGFVVPTESNLVSTHQVFEQLALANGCQLIAADGRVMLLEPACQEALDFYFEIIHNYSPVGVQTDTSTRNAYLFGRAGLIITPPTILPQLAGLDAATPPTCPECGANPAYLAENSGFLTHISGSGTAATPANFSQLTYLGITREADTETAVAFARYWFTEGYEQWLRVEPERKVPLRRGTTTAPNQFIDAWGSFPVAGSDQSLTDLYGARLVAQLQNEVAAAARWGIGQGQGFVITSLYENLTFSIVLQEMLSGYFNSEKTLVESYNRVIDLIPNYAYDLELEEPADQ